VSAEVLAAARRRSDALVGKDIETLLALMHPDCLYINSQGAVLSRDEYIDKYVRSNDVRWTSQTLRMPHFTAAGEAVVLTCLVHDVATFFGQSLDTSFRSTSTWISTADGWRCLATHTSPAE
jgi:ketosteroid isomerase-like protein